MDEKKDCKELYLCLDSLSEEGYFYTNYDIGGAGHSITIKAEDKDKFLDAFAREWRNRAEQALEEVKEEDEDY